jgi:hypothetical protein
MRLSSQLARVPHYAHFTYERTVARAFPGSTKTQPTHLKRQAVVYLRQSTPQQVLKNRESSRNRAIAVASEGTRWAKLNRPTDEVTK